MVGSAPQEIPLYSHQNPDEPFARGIRMYFKGGEEAALNDLRTDIENTTRLTQPPPHWDERKMYQGREHELTHQLILRFPLRGNEDLYNYALARAQEMYRSAPGETRQPLALPGRYGGALALRGAAAPPRPPQYDEYPDEEEEQEDQPRSHFVRNFAGAIVVTALLVGGAGAVVYEAVTHAPIPSARPHPSPEPSPTKQPSEEPTQPLPTEKPTVAPPVPTPTPTEPGPEKPAEDTLTVLSSNVLGKSHTSKAHGVKWTTRMRGMISLFDREQADVIGLQEFQTPQNRLFRKVTKGRYAVYPETIQPKHHYSENSIAYNPDRLKLIKGGYDTIWYFNSHSTKTPRVLFEDKKTGVRFYMVNAHDPANTRKYPRQAHNRVHDGHVHDNNNQENIRDGYPVIYTADANSSVVPRPKFDHALGGNEKLQIPNILTAKGNMQLAWSKAQNLKDASMSRFRQVIDLVVVSNTIGVKSFNTLSTGKYSDHKISKAVVELPKLPTN